MSDASPAYGNQSLGVFGIYGEAMSITTKNYVKFALLIAVPLIVIGLAVRILTPSLLEAIANPFALQAILANADAAFYLLLILIVVIAGLIAAFITGSMMYAIYTIKSGQPMSIVAAFNFGFKRMVQLFVVNLVVGIVVNILLGIFAGLMNVIFGDSGAAIIGMIALMVLAFYIAALIICYAPAVVVENSWFGSVARAVGLSKDYRWPTVGLLALAYLTAIVIMTVFFLLLRYVLVGILINLGTVGGIIMSVLFALVMVFIASFAISTITLVYSRLREIKEGASMSELAAIFE